MKTGYIYHLHDRRLPNSVGQKTRNLRRIMRLGFQVPETFACTWQAYLDFLQDGSPTLERLRIELQPLLAAGRSKSGSYAVRSSANLEDGLEHSFAGQFKTVLEVRGLDAVLQAVIEIWQATQSETVQTYRKKVAKAHQPLKMAVIIQEMINPVLSGVAFSKNPINGLDEIIVEAVAGPGTGLVQDGLTPYRWVHKWGHWILQPDSNPVGNEVIQQVVTGTQAIAKEYKRAVDLEWVYDGRELYWLQARAITAVVPTNIYSNKLAREITPGMIKPLVWSVNLPIVGDSWVHLICEVTGPNNLDPDRLAKAFYYRAYHNLGQFGKIFDSLGMPRESLEIMMGMVPRGAGMPKMMPGIKGLRHLPRLLGFIAGKWVFQRRAEREFPLLEAEAHRFPLQPSPQLGERQLLDLIEQATDLSQRVSYNTVLSILLMQIYCSVLKGRLARIGVDFQNFDLTENLEALKAYEPGLALERLHTQFKALDPAAQEIVRIGDWAALQSLPGLATFRQEVEAFLARFGHLGDSGSDFGSAPWRETPGLVLKIIAGYTPSAELPAARTHFADLQLSGMSGMGLKLFYERARRFRLYREMYSSLFTYTLMLLRTLYLVLGDRFVARGILAGRDDIYYLYGEEVRRFVTGQTTGQEFLGLVAQRVAEMEEYKDIVLPEVIYGESLPLVVLSRAEKLTGVPTSRGYYTGQVKVVCGLGDFSKVQMGEILVIPYSDVGWSPLFAKAGGLISESGGLLSHSSIIAREYNIPAVVSVANATRLLRDGDQVTIDGYKGEILLAI